MTDLPLCPCGCGAPVKSKRRKYATRGCWARDPRRRDELHRRALAAGIASREAYARRAAERGNRYRTRAKAYVAGYETGYFAAYRFWKSKYRRLLAENAALRERPAA